MPVEMLYRSKRVLLDSGIQEAGILVGTDGRIKQVLLGEQLNNYDNTLEVLDAGDLVIMPGLTDCHVHVNEPGRSEWEGYWTATRAAAAGGVTTIVDMPLNSIPPTTTVANLETKLAATVGKLHVDVAFWGGVIPGNQDDLKDMVRAGVVGFKCFLCPSGVDEFPGVTKGDVELALKQLQGTNAVLAFHAECELETSSVTTEENPEEYKTFLRSRPPDMEVTAVQLVAELCTKYNVRCHIVHLSAAEVLPIVRSAKAKGANLTAETCHHYLTLSAESVPNNAVEYKCCPPVRGTQNKETLWSALKSRDIDMVVSDHSPCTPELKYTPESDGDFMRAWGGISSLQFGLSLFWTQARKRGFDLTDVNRLMSLNTTRLVGIDKKKGRLAVGMDADLIIWDPDQTFNVEKSMILHKHKLTPYMGMTLYGQVKQTVVRGNTVYEQGKPFLAPHGRTILNSVATG